MATVRKGDTVTIGPFTAALSDGTVLDLTGALIEAEVKVARGATAAITRENTAAGGGDDEIEITDAVNGIFYVYLTSANTDTLSPGVTYYCDARVKLSTGEVYTVGEASFTIIQPYTAIPA